MKYRERFRGRPVPEPSVVGEKFIKTQRALSVTLHHVDERERVARERAAKVAAKERAERSFTERIREAADRAKTVIVRRRDPKKFIRHPRESATIF